MLKGKLTNLTIGGRVAPFNRVIIRDGAGNITHDLDARTAAKPFPRLKIFRHWVSLQTKGAQGFEVIEEPTGLVALKTPGGLFYVGHKFHTLAELKGVARGLIEVVLDPTQELVWADDLNESGKTLLLEDQARRENA